jgi:hypothetical protein
MEADPASETTLRGSGGARPNALLVQAAQERSDYRTFLVASVGDDSEHGGAVTE